MNSQAFNLDCISSSYLCTCEVIYAPVKCVAPATLATHMNHVFFCRSRVPPFVAVMTLDGACSVAISSRSQVATTCEASSSLYCDVSDVNVDSKHACRYVVSGGVQCQLSWPRLLASLTKERLP